MAVSLTQEMIQGAIMAQQKYGVPASVTLAQIIQESGGKYPGGLSGLAYNDNNLFGIKAGSSWKGKVAYYNTKEWNGSKYITVKAGFRKYDSIAQSIDDHGKLLNSSIYTNKTKNAKTLEEYVKAMGSVYATDPNYATSLLKTIKTYGLDKYDTGNFPTGTLLNSSVDFGLFDEDMFWGLGNANNLFGITWSDVVKVIVVILIIILAIICLVKAFDIHPVKAIKGATE